MKAKTIPTFILFPAIVSVAIALIYAASSVLGIDISQLGIYPRTLDGLKGILFSPFIHGSVKHLMSNLSALPLLLCLLTMLYPERYFKIFSVLYLFTGIAVWLSARSSYHIGASGIIYAIASYIFFAGIVSSKKGAAAVSVIIVLFYGGMIWGVLPGEPHISWESHLAGGAAGFVAAFIFSSRTEPTAIGNGDYQAPQFSPKATVTDSQYTSVTYEYKEKQSEETN